MMRAKLKCVVCTLALPAALSAAGAPARAADTAADPQNLDYRVWEVFEFYPQDTQLECTVQVDAAGPPGNDIIDWGIDALIGPVKFGRESVFPGLAAMSWTQKSAPGGWRAQVSLLGNCRASIPAFRRLAEAAAADAEGLRRLEITAPEILSPALTGGAWWVGDPDYHKLPWDAHRRAAGGCSARAWIDLADAHAKRSGGGGTVTAQYTFLYLARLIAGGAAGAAADEKTARLKTGGIPEDVLADARRRARRYVEIKNCPAEITQ